jgi:O-antigen ligase
MPLAIFPLPSRIRALFAHAGYPTLFALFFGGALVSSLFFNGTYIEYFALAGVLLTVLLLAVLWRGYNEGFRLPKTALALSLTLFWAWLALGLIWSRVPYVSMVNFWWVGSIALVFWLATLTPDIERCWQWASRAVFLVGLFLAGMALYQLLILGADPRSTFLSRNSHAAFLILVAIPASSYFLLAHQNLQRVIAGAALFILFLAIAVTGSRGVMLSLLIGAVVIVAVAWRRVPKGRLIEWFVIVAGAYLAANFFLHGWLAGRLGSVLAPGDAGHDRFLIWHGALKMALDAPWLGIGLGTFWLAWPPYRLPADSSAGFYVHNDYLQLWIETGLPGLLLLLAIEVSVLVLFVRALRNTKVETPVRLEMAGLVGGLMAIAFHSFFDFDLYIHPILLVIGLMLARLQYLDGLQQHTDPFMFAPSLRVGRRAYRAIIILLLLLPVLYFAALGFSARFTVQAREYATQGRWVEASAMLNRAWQLMPSSDMTLVIHAELLRQAIPALPPDAQKQRAVLYNEALMLLVTAEKVNPLRAQIYYIRGMLYQQNPDLAGPRSAEFAAENYRQTLRVDPRALWARMGYAQMLLAHGRLADARSVLDEGIGYWYLPEPQAFAYYSLTAQLRRRSGDHTGAAALLQKLDHLQRAARVRTDPFGPQLKLIQPEPGKP